MSEAVICLTIAGMLLPAACSVRTDRPDRRAGQDIVIVRVPTRDPVTHASLPASAGLSMQADPGIDRDDDEPAQLAAITAARDADPYRIADVDLPREAFE